MRSTSPIFRFSSFVLVSEVSLSSTTQPSSLDAGKALGPKPTSLDWNTSSPKSSSANSSSANSSSSSSSSSSSQPAQLALALEPVPSECSSSPKSSSSSSPSSSISSKSSFSVCATQLSVSTSGFMAS